jgi:hypothetical protein
MTNERHDEESISVILSAVKNIVKFTQKESIKNKTEAYFDAEFETLEILESRERNLSSKITQEITAL